jgi:uncharacterized membrane protein
MGSELRTRGFLGGPQNLDVTPLVLPSSSGNSTMETGKVLFIFLLYSMAMFTLPFVAYAGTTYGLKYFGIEGFANTAWSVVAAVVMVNTIIMSYACIGYHEDMEFTEQESKQQQHKTDLNLKAD